MKTGKDDFIDKFEGLPPATKERLGECFQAHPALFLYAQQLYQQKKEVAAGQRSVAEILQAEKDQVTQVLNTLEKNYEQSGQ